MRKREIFTIWVISRACSGYCYGMGLFSMFGIENGEFSRFEQFRLNVQWLKFEKVNLRGRARYWITSSMLSFDSHLSLFASRVHRHQWLICAGKKPFYQPTVCGTGMRWRQTSSIPYKCPICCNCLNIETFIILAISHKTPFYIQQHIGIWSLLHRSNPTHVLGNGELEQKSDFMNASQFQSAEMRSRHIHEPRVIEYHEMEQSFIAVYRFPAAIDDFNECPVIFNGRYVSNGFHWVQWVLSPNEKMR